MRVGAHEAVLAHAIRAVLLDRAGGLEDAVVAVGRRLDAIALVFDRLGRRAGAIAAGPGAETAQQGLEFRKHRSPFVVQASIGHCRATSSPRSQPPSLMHPLALLAEGADLFQI